MIRLLLCSWLLMPSLAFAQAEATGDATGQKVAVVGFKATGVDEGVAANLVDIFTTEAGSLPGYTVIGQSEIQETVGFAAQQSMLGCDDAKCITDFAGSLGVDLIVTGRIGKVGDTFVVSMQLIDVKKKEAVNRISETVVGQVDVLLYYVRYAAWVLFMQDAPPAVKEKYDNALSAAAPAGSEGSTTEVLNASADVSAPAPAVATQKAGPASDGGMAWAKTARKVSTGVAVLGILSSAALMGASYGKSDAVGDSGESFHGDDLYGGTQSEAVAAERFQTWSIIAGVTGGIGIIAAIVFKVLEPSADTGAVSWHATPSGVAVTF